MEKKGRISVSLKDKLSILKDIEDGKKPKVICQKYKKIYKIWSFHQKRIEVRNKSNE